MKRMKRSALLCTLLLTLALLLAACGAKSNAARDSAEFYSTGSMKAEPEMDVAYGWDGGYAADEVAPAAIESGKLADMSYSKPTAGAAQIADKTAKMVYTANLQLQTLSFDEAEKDISALVSQLGGYFENKSLSNYSSGYRYANYVVRVPASQFTSFCNQLGTLCHVIYRNEYAQNISDVYYDTESRLETAKIKLDRLQELLAKADNMGDIITIESAISETEWTIENLSGTLRSYDAQVDYATVTIDLNEVYKLSNQEDAPMTFGERLASSFRRGLTAAGNALEDLVLWFAFNWIGLLIALVVLAVLLLLLRRARRKSRSLRGSGEKRPRRRFITVEKLTEEEMNEEENKEE